MFSLKNQIVVYALGAILSMLQLLNSSAAAHSMVPSGSDGKKSACNAEDPGLIPRVKKIPLEKGMATHSSILAWRIPWTEEAGGLPSMGPRRIKHY